MKIDCEVLKFDFLKKMHVITSEIVPVSNVDGCFMRGSLVSVLCLKGGCAI